jgi:cadmium resistance transport/sequestration family protein
MGWLFSTLITGFTAFAATNIDDILVLIMFFTQVNDQFRPRHILAGQYLGFVILLLASLPGYLGGLVLPKPWLGLLGILPILMGLKHLLQKDDAVAVQNISLAAAPPLTGWKRLLNPKIYKVALVTLANGGDNIGIYVPLFAGRNLPELSVILGIFLAMIAVWCAIAHSLVRHPGVAPLLSRYAHRVVPFVLIGLGLYILFENGSLQLLPRS